MSRAAWSSGMEFIATTLDFAASARDGATRKSEGRTRLTPRSLQRSITFRAIGTPSGSRSDLPMPRPRATTKWFAIPPPTRSVSARSTRASRAAIFPRILAPPRIPTKGRSMSSTTFPSAFSSFSMRRPTPRASGGEVDGHAGRRGVGAVRRAEGVVDVDLGEGGEALGEGGVVPLLARVEAGVLEDEDVAVGERRHGRLGHRADAVGGEGDGRAEELPELLRHRGERVLRVGRPLRLAEVGGEDDPRSLLAGEADRREGLRDPRVVLHDAVLDRDVEVDAQEDAAAGELEVPDAAGERGHQQTPRVRRLGNVPGRTGASWREFDSIVRA